MEEGDTTEALVNILTHIVERGLVGSTIPPENYNEGVLPRSRRERELESMKWIYQPSNGPHKIVGSGIYRFSY